MNDEKTFLVKIKGASPLIMHSCEGADPENKWTKELAPLKAKRKKTDADRMAIRDLSFVSSLYWSNELDGLFMPTDNVIKMLLEAGRALDQKNAKKQIVGIGFDQHLGWPLLVDNRSDIELLKQDPKLRYSRIVTIAKAKVPSVRAIFNEWAFELNIIIDCSIVNPSTVEEWLTYAGKRVGLGSRRPYAPTPGQYGKFYIEDMQEVKYS